MAKKIMARMGQAPALLLSCASDGGTSAARTGDAGSGVDGHDSGAGASGAVQTDADP